MHARLRNDKKLWKIRSAFIYCTSLWILPFLPFFLIPFFFRVFLFFSLSNSYDFFSFRTKAFLLHRRNSQNSFLFISFTMTHCQFFHDPFSILSYFNNNNAFLCRSHNCNLKSRIRSFRIQRLLLTLAVATPPVRHLWNLTFPVRILQTLKWQQRRIDYLLFVLRNVYLS